jgi:hypothetical protein
MYEKKLHESEKNYHVLEQQLSDEALKRRKFQYDMNMEKKRMQKTLEDALIQLKNSQEDVVDRTLISNLIVSYFQRKRYCETD